MFTIVENIRIDSTLWLIISLWVCIGFIYIHIHKKKKKNFKNIWILEEVYISHSLWYKVFLLFLFLIWLLYIAILGKLHLSRSYETLQKDGRDIIIAFDISYSMIANDIEPTRLEAAKSLFHDLVTELPWDRIWLVLFAGKALQSVPLTYDHDFLKKTIKNTKIDTINQNISSLQGTAIGDSLLMSYNMLSKQEEERKKVIILLSDGEANKWVDPTLALRLLRDKNIKVYTLGLWKDEKATIEVLNPFWIPQKIEVGGIDEVLMKKIAFETEWLYYRVDSEEKLDIVINDISQLEKSPLEVEIYQEKRYFMKEFSLILILLYVCVTYIYLYKGIRH